MLVYMTPIAEIQTGNIQAACIAHEWLTGVVKQIDGETITLKGRCLGKEDAPSFFSATPDQLVPIPFEALISLEIEYEKTRSGFSTVRIKDKEITFLRPEGGPRYLYSWKDVENGSQSVGGGQGVSDYLNFLRKLELIEEADRITKLFIEKFNLE